MVNLTRIYTRTGDDGSTALGDLSRTRKTDVRLAAYADANEANAAIGLAIACGDLPTTCARCSPGCRTTCSTSAPTCRPRCERSHEYPPLRVKQEWVDELEADCDRFLERAREAAVLHPPGRHGGRRAPARGADGRAPRRALGVGGLEAYGTEPGESGRGRGQPGDGDLPQPALRPALRARPRAPTCPAVTCCGSPAAAASSRPTPCPTRRRVTPMRSGRHASGDVDVEARGAGLQPGPHRRVGRRHERELARLRPGPPLHGHRVGEPGDGVGQRHRRAEVELTARPTTPRPAARDRRC